ncbi:MAG: YlxR family protein [Candidatus Dormiibacterota bacterium]
MSEHGRRDGGVEHPAEGARRQPLRTCVGCRRQAAQRDLVRVVRGVEGRVAVDGTGRAPGRGAYLHPDPACLAGARKARGLERALRTRVDDAVWTALRRLLDA